MVELIVVKGDGTEGAVFGAVALRQLIDLAKRLLSPVKLLVSNR